MTVLKDKVRTVRLCTVLPERTEDTATGVINNKKEFEGKENKNIV